MLVRHTGMTNQSMPEDRQARFRQTYTVLVALLNAMLPPIITVGPEDAPSTDHEIALGR